MNIICVLHKALTYLAEHVVLNIKSQSHLQFSSFFLITDFFDIIPKACWASTINLIEDKCPMDENLFSGFTGLSAGYISNTFYMFRPTTMLGGKYDVTFTCLLEVCMYTCEPVRFGFFVILF